MTSLHGSAAHSMAPLSRHRRKEPVQDELNIRNKLRSVEQLPGIHTQGGKGQSVSCTDRRSISNSTITMAMPSNIAGTAPAVAP